MQVVPLNETYLKEATKLLEKVFNPSKEEKLTLKASFYPQKYNNVEKIYVLDKKIFLKKLKNSKIISGNIIYVD